MKIIRVCDIESATTNDPPDNAIVEIGWQDIGMEQDSDGNWKPTLIPDTGGGSRLVNPGRPIECTARAIHHISNADVADAPPLRDVLDSLSEGADFFAAHSSAYEKKFLGELLPAKPWLCTLKASRRIWPDAPSHSLQALRYWRLWPIDRDPSAWPPHRAGADAYVGAWLLIDLIESGATVREMVAWEKVPSLLPGKMGFGKHKDLPWSECPPDYLDWVISQPDMDEDKAFTARYWLAQREVA